MNDNVVPIGGAQAKRTVLRHSVGRVATFKAAELLAGDIMTDLDFLLRGKSGYIEVRDKNGRLLGARIVAPSQSALRQGLDKTKKL